MENRKVKQQGNDKKTEKKVKGNQSEDLIECEYIADSQVIEKEAEGEQQSQDEDYQRSTSDEEMLNITKKCQGELGEVDTKHRVSRSTE